MQGAEIELKFRVDSLSGLERKFAELGFRVATPRTFETNTLYDTPERSLRTRGELLRVRGYGARSVVTHKRHPDRNDEKQEEAGSLYKVRIETESEVADGPALAAIFERLGYLPAFRYEKYRSEFEDDQAGGHAVIDETPIGVYAELEGPTDWIDRTLAALGISPADCLTQSYGKLFLEWRRETGSEAENLTFAEVEQAQRIAPGKLSGVAV